MLARERKRLVEIFGIEPCLGAELVSCVIIPQPRSFDIECALLLLIAGLDAEARHGPLPAHPIHVAMQGHDPSSPKAGCRRSQKRRIPGCNAFATGKAASPA